jgi:hypothetical protein
MLGDKWWLWATVHRSRSKVEGLVHCWSPFCRSKGSGVQKGANSTGLHRSYGTLRLMLVMLGLDSLMQILDGKPLMPASLPGICIWTAKRLKES